MKDDRFYLANERYDLWSAYSDAESGESGFVLY